MEEAVEFQDWEVLQSSDMGFLKKLDSEDKSSDSEEIEGGSGGVIRSDYFTLDFEKRYARTVSKGDQYAKICEEVSVESNEINPSYGDDAMLVLKNSGEIWSDSNDDRSVCRKLNEFEGKTDLGFGEDAINEVGFKRIGEIEAQDKDSLQFCSDSDGDSSVPVKLEDVKGGNESGLSNRENTIDGAEFSAEAEGANGSESDGVMGIGGADRFDSAKFIEGERGEVHEEIAKFSAEEVNSREEEKGRMVWWKVPLDLLKIFVFRIKPVWSFSIAAAVMGFVILGRRLYKMKRKSRSFPLTITVEDKKVSQFMTRAARLNEAFSVVKRVPIIRPSLPSSGLTPWPVMTLR